MATLLLVGSILLRAVMATLLVGSILVLAAGVSKVVGTEVEEGEGSAVEVAMIILKVLKVEDGPNVGNFSGGGQIGFNPNLGFQPQFGASGSHGGNPVGPFLPSGEPVTRGSSVVGGAFPVGGGAALAGVSVPVPAGAGCGVHAQAGAAYPVGGGGGSGAVLGGDAVPGGAAFSVAVASLPKVGGVQPSGSANAASGGAIAQVTGGSGGM
ncbi:Os12g0432150 [Oryza sativa Japonica Group]|uniref:Os12g0432150 protein n=1 Tax=Oryza sativa subsp. japonica TaxID=39947 RepID=A0A0P0Y9R6_ORYSJ|nr:Os12g0432150 [Oryza sativa Japonica Group]